MILYFSGTGNSRHVAQRIAEVTGDDCEDIATHLRKGESASYESERPYVFVGPVYAGRYPKVMTKFIEDSRFAGSRDAYFVATCAETPWITVDYAGRLAASKGFSVLGFNSVLMPQSYATGGLTTPPEENERILAAAEPKISAIAEAIRDGKPLPEEPRGKAWMSRVANPMMYAFMMGTGSFAVTDKCVHCGTCAATCPLGNIRMVDGTPTWGKRCTQCNACIGVCPQGAIEYGKKTVGKPRYYYGKGA
jgi:ferredoxin